jgi:uncharacterized protein YjbI with pentapeptide repeats
MSRENVLLLPIEERRCRGLSTIEEVITSLKARFTPNFNTTNFNTADFNTTDFNTTDFDTADFNTTDLVSSKEIIEEL